MRSYRFSCIALLISIAPLSGCADPELPHVRLVTLDTTRADRLGCYGYPKPTSPNLDALARESVVYRKAVSTSSWTLPAHASLFTGKFPTSHGSQYDPEGPLMLTSAIEGPPEWGAYRARGLAPDEITLAELLRERGYATAAVVGGPWMKKVFGLNKGFDHYDDDQIRSVQGRLAEDLTDSAIGWLDANPGRPFFLFLNYYDPHTPYWPPEEFGRKFFEPGMEGLEAQRALYDGEIASMDHHFGRLIQRLKESGQYDRTWIIVTADHGELLGEHGKMGHGHYLTQWELHIPLIVKFPFGERSAGEDSQWVQLTDLFAMILERLGLPLPAGTQGESPPGVRHPIVAEVYPLPFTTPDGDWRSLIEGDYKFLWNSLGKHELYQLAHDPGERNSLASLQPDVARSMERTLTAFLDGLPRPVKGDDEPIAVDPETQEALKSLGYVD